MGIVLCDIWRRVQCDYLHIFHRTPPRDIIPSRIFRNVLVTIRERYCDVNACPIQYNLLLDDFWCNFICPKHGAPIDINLFERISIPSNQMGIIGQSRPRGHRHLSFQIPELSKSGQTVYWKWDSLITRFPIDAVDKITSSIRTLHYSITWIHTTATMLQEY